ncbi:MAG: GerMN domain-containing protein [Actinomycetota bacterium]
MKNNSLNRKLLVLYRTAIYAGCILLILSFILFSVGCESVDGTDTASENGSVASSDIENVSDSGEEISENDNSTNAEEEIEESSEENQAKTGDNEDTSEDELTIKVYYADEQAEYLIGESRKVSSENRYEEALYELMKLPVDSSLIRLIPDTTIINSVEVENGLARVDLSDNFVENRYQGDAADILLVYSVVNTLTEFQEVNSVTFYIDGKKLNTLGSLDISSPVYRKNDLIKN